MFTLWSHSVAALDDFLNHLNSLRPTIKFTMEVETENMLPFLDVRVTGDPSTLMTKTKIYRKSTHTDRYVNFCSYHRPPSVKHGIIRTLAHRTETICSDGDSLKCEKKHLTTVFKSNGYPPVSIRKAMQPIKNKNEIEDTKAITTIPYIRGVSEKIRRICSKVGIKVMFRSGRTLRSLLTKVKPKTDLTESDTTGVVYCIPCMDCNRSYIHRRDLQNTQCTTKRTPTMLQKS